MRFFRFIPLAFLLTVSLAFAAQDADLNGALDVNRGGTNATSAEAARTNLGITDDQTAAEVNITDTGTYYTGTTVEAALQEVGVSLAADGDVFYVLDHGATCDGVANDTTGIQAAIDAAESAGGGVVQFPAFGTCRASNLTVQADNVVLRGYGGASTLKRISGSTGNFISFSPVTPSTTRQFENGLHDLILEAEDATTTGAAVLMHGLIAPTVTNIQLKRFPGSFLVGDVLTAIFDNIQIYAGKGYDSADDTYGWRFDYMDGNVADHPVAIYISNVQLRYDIDTYDYTEALKYGIDIKAIDGLWVSNFHTNVLGEAAIYVHPATGQYAVSGFIQNLYVDGDNPTWGTFNGVEFTEAGGGGISRWTVDGGELRGAGATPNKYGAVIASGKGIKLSNLDITGYQTAGVSITGGSDITLNGNTIARNGLDVSVGNGVSEFTLTDNHVSIADPSGISTITASAGVQIGTGCTSYQVKDNIFGQFRMNNIIDASKAASGQIGHNVLYAATGGDDYTEYGGGGGSDEAAIHDNVSGEINAITEKASPVSGDILIIEDSAASYAKKKVQIGNLPGGGSGDITDVWSTTTGNVNSLTAAAGDSLNAANADYSIPWVRKAACTSETVGQGRACFDTSTDRLFTSTATTWALSGGAGTGGSMLAVTTVGNPGSDANVPSEQAVREAISAATGADPPGTDGNVVYNNGAAWGGLSTVAIDDTDTASPGLVITSIAGASPPVTRGLILYQHSSSPAGGNIAAYKSMSADSTPAAGDVINGVVNLNTYLGYGWDGNSYELAGGLYIQSEGAFTDATPTGAFKVFLDNGTTYAEKFRVNSDGGVTWSNGVEPTCSSTHRGKIIFVQGGAGVADTLRICKKDSGDAYAWTALY